MESSLRAFVFFVTLRDKTELSILIVAEDRYEAHRIFREEYHAKMSKEDKIEKFVYRAEGLPLEKGLAHAGITRSSEAMEFPGKTFIPGPQWLAAEEARYATANAATRA